MNDHRTQKIIEYLHENGLCSSRQIFDHADIGVSYATLKRMLSMLQMDSMIVSSGEGKGTRYRVSPILELIEPIDLERYFEKEIDERVVREGFNYYLIRDILEKNSVFTASEIEKLNYLQLQFRQNISQLSDNEYRKEFERLAIDLSWKSSQIEGNTYSLLETERLLWEKETASGKTKDEAIMLLNHKKALDFLLENPGYLEVLSISKIEDLHSILVSELSIDRNLRKRRVGITGTNFRPLDNEFQIIEALQNTCDVINSGKNVFEKALLAIVLISYIQPFTDGNKRTARMAGNAILMNEKHCPLSFRTVDSMHYKKAMLLFYEQNNISAFKKIFIDQYEFAVETYF